MTALTHHTPYVYSAIPDRAQLRWPGGAKVAVYVAVNLEWFSFGKGPGATLDGEKAAPDVQNYSWRDYGNRVGVWRIMRLLDELKMPAAWLPNVCLYDEAPEIMDAVRARGDEIVGHGVTNSVKPGELERGAERKVIEQTRDAIAQAEGAPPAGWLAPWISQSRSTPELLAQAGYRYHMDWCHDDQPVWMRTDQGPILSVPYPQELNDIPQIVGRGHEGAQFAEMILNALEVHRADPWGGVMGIALHPYLMGQPHRFHHLQRALKGIVNAAEDDVWITTPGAIAEHYTAQFPAP